MIHSAGNRVDFFLQARADLTQIYKRLIKGCVVHLEVIDDFLGDQEERGRTTIGEKRARQGIGDVGSKIRPLAVGEDI
jgi:hypothetical protein